MRVLLAKQVSLNKWVQRIDSTQASEASFAASVAAQFGIPVGDVEVVLDELTSAQCETAAQELAAGTFRGLAVVPAPTNSNPLASELATNDVIQGDLAAVTQRIEDVRVNLTTAIAGVTNLSEAKSVMTQMNNTYAAAFKKIVRYLRAIKG